MKTLFRGIPILPSLIALGLWSLYLNLVTPGFLNFSDGAKFADIARNVVNGLGYGGSFNFFGLTFEQTKQFPFPAPWAPPAMPLSVAAAFKILGISDFSVVATSGLFYISLVLATFVLGRKLFGNLVGFLSAVAIAANLNFLDYATSGASEVLFTLEVVLAAYLFILRKNWATTLGLLTLILMYFTRPQAFLFIAGFIFLWLLLRFDLRRAFLISLVLGIVGLVIDRLILEPLAGRFFLYPILGRGLRTFFQYSPLAPASIGLRAELPTTELITSQWVILSKKVFFNLYNFYKLLPQIASPYMWALFAIGLFAWGKDRTVNALKFVTLLLVIGIFLITALTIPFFRYLHPVIPLVYLFAVATLVTIVETVVRVQWSGFSGWRTQLVALVASFLVFVFVVGQTLGVIFLDSRFWAQRRNIGKPPVYVQLSWILRDNTEPDGVIITNLDTWGSWYGERRTIWYPLRPEQLIPPEGGEIPFDAIYLTSYLIDDENYYMGPDWRQIFENPKSPKDEFIAKNYRFVGEFKVSADETYEKQEARAILLIKKHGE